MPPPDDSAAAPLSLAAPQPGTLGPLRPPLFNVALFLLTLASAFVAGAYLTDTQLPEPTPPEMLRHGLSFSLALLAIMLAHEMGHFVLSRAHGVDATWPFFIPAPIVSIIGTFGAVIRLRTLPRTRRALVDIGAAGPLAGLAVTFPVLIAGLRLSTPVPIEPAGLRWSLFEAFMRWQETGSWPGAGGAFDLGRPLGMALCERLFGPHLAAGQTLALHPVAVAGWFGFFLTALNLLPLGQLDGGHCLYAASPRLHRLLGPPVSALLLALGIFTPFPGWILWGLLLGLALGAHPPIAEPEEELTAGRRLVLALSLFAFALSFSPVPLALLAG